MRATGDTMMRHDDGDGRHNNGKGQHGDMRYVDGDMPYVDGNRRQHGDGKGQQGTGSTTTAKVNMTSWHDKGDKRRTTTIRYFLLTRLAEDYNTYILLSFSCNP